MVIHCCEGLLGAACQRCMMTCCAISAKLKSCRCEIFKNVFSPTFTLIHVCVLDYEPKYAITVLYIMNNYKNKNWLQFLFIVKAAVLKQQISKFYLQILSTKDSFYIYDRPLNEINLITPEATVLLCPC